MSDRPTPLEGAETGLANWLRMFAYELLGHLTPEQQCQIIASVEQQLRPTLYRDGGWIADYRRLRIMAVKH
jgi:hypothetical protein